MSRTLSLGTLWDTTPPGTRIFDPSDYTDLPPVAQRYLEHAIAPGTPLATAVRLHMTGEIKIKNWSPFTAEQVIRWDRGLIWKARTRVNGLPVGGFDSLIDGRGEMRWRMLGLIPVMTGTGVDVDKSAAGRLAAEAVWLPSALCRSDVEWYADDSSAHARFVVAGQPADLELAVDESGRLEGVCLQRWGETDGVEGYRYWDFGGPAECESTFQGYTIPTHMRVGWHYPSDRFESEGEFFRCRITNAEFR